MDKYPHLPIGELCHIEKGVTGLASAIPGDYPLVSTGAERKSCNSFQFDTEAVCIPLVSSTGHGKKTLNYVHYQSGKFALGSILAAVIPENPRTLSAAFLHRYLQFYKDRKIVPLMKGAANVSLAIKDIAKITVPVPPIDKQKAFIELFNKLIDSHVKLQKEFSNQASYLTRLRQAVLQEAIEGKLTADWRKRHPELISGENHASKLLEKIKAEKERLIKEGKIKKDKPLPPITDAEKLCDLPRSWVLCRLGDLIKISSGDGLTAKEMTEGGDYPVFGGNGINGYHDKFNVKKPTIVIGRVGALCGSVHVTPERAWITDNAFITYYFEQYLNSNWLVKLLIALDLRNRARETAQPVISGKRVYPIIIALPSSAEQQAIVERVDKLMSMIDELEKQVTERKDKSERLMQSVLREAFEGKA